MPRTRRRRSARARARSATLEATRDALQVDVEALERHVEVQRGRLAGHDRRSAAAARRAGAAVGVAVDAPGDCRRPSRRAPSRSRPTPSGEGRVDRRRGRRPRPPRSPPSPRSPAAERGRSSWPRTPTTTRPGPASAPTTTIVDDGPRTEPVLRLDRDRGRGRRGGDDDAYLTELRKAMLDDTGAPDDVGHRPVRRASTTPEPAPPVSAAGAELAVRVGQVRPATTSYPIPERAAV